MPGFDIGVIPLAPSGRLEEISPSLSPFNSRQGVLSGLAKLSQSVIFLFATEPGSVVYNPTLGASPVQTILRQNNLQRDIIDDALSNSASAILQQIKTFNGLPALPEERLGYLKIEAIDFDEQTGIVSIRIELRSQAGDNAEYTVALTIPIE